jgi:hypothetical protein
MRPRKKVEDQPQATGLILQRPTNNFINDHHAADAAQPSNMVGQTRCNALRRRRLASQRMVPLDCGCRDPWPCRCTDPPLTERMVDGWRDAALHVLPTGHIPLLPLEARQALWRRGGRDRALAELLHDACGGEPA